jgi:hypothetical protein
LVTRCRSRTVAKVDSIGLVAQLDPVLAGEVLESEQHVEVVVSTFLGHASVMITLDRYGHLFCRVERGRLRSTTDAQLGAKHL